MIEHRTQFSFNGKREHIVKVNTPNMTYPGQHINIEIPHGSRDHVIVSDTIKITFNLEIKSADKARSVVSNVGRALVKKKELMLDSKSIDMIKNSDVYDTHKDLYLSKKEHEENLLQGIQLVNTLKTRMGAKKVDGTALTVTTLENATKKTFDNRFAIPLDFDFFMHPVYSYGLREDFARLELTSAGKVILCGGNISEIYKLSDISLENNAIFDEPYATAIGRLYVGTSILYTKVESIHYQILSKKDTICKIDANNLSVRSLQGLLLLFRDKCYDFANKNEEFYKPSINKVLVIINGDPRQFLNGGLRAMDISPELKKHFHK